MNFKDLAKLAQEAKTAKESTEVVTFDDIKDEAWVKPLPAGIHECKILEVPKVEKSPTINLIVEVEGVKHELKLYIPQKRGSKQFEIFFEQLNHLVDQLQPGATPAVIPESVGKTFCVSVTENGIFKNFVFDARRIAYLITQK